MTNDHLLALAVSAIDDDAGAWEGLEDALQERREHFYRDDARRVPWDVYSGVRTSERIREPHVIAAVILFNEWSTTLWPVAKRCELPARIVFRNGGWCRVTSWTR